MGVTFKKVYEGFIKNKTGLDLRQEYEQLIKFNPVLSQAQQAAIQAVREEGLKKYAKVMEEYRELQNQCVLKAGETADLYKEYIQKEINIIKDAKLKLQV